MRKWLADLREEAGYSQQALADRIMISRSHLSSIEVGTRDPSVDTAKSISSALGFQWTLFFEDNGRISSRKTTA
ncbi:hypothetical protein JCM19037_3673 [Geomicrobium sp. JCM 19037]|uniref:helix-turn-helix transcriptional regulator n=1 Tax=Geomicrobium sp. JCM 19037 TaxID=1460634 RepID=UPI00045F32BD|nr:helix-turn-helix transcriptional regulator [Geomicrobium sp. JCM 19037]GAK05195.1 hypothetical protein JCM19037_3673 [Geomicrobium sp. JCM 19037]